MHGNKGVLTTGQVAKICQVAPRTVSKWFDSGQLLGYRVPGSKDRRIPVDDLARFMRAHGIPLGDLETGKTRILVVDTDHERKTSLVSALEHQTSCEAASAGSAFGAGVMAAKFRPDVILVDASVAFLRSAHGDKGPLKRDALPEVKLVATTSDPAQADGLKRAGYDACLVRPFDVKTVLTVVDSIQFPSS